MISMNPLHNHINNNYDGSKVRKEEEAQGINKGNSNGSSKGMGGSSKGNSNISVSRSGTGSGIVK